MAEQVEDNVRHAKKWQMDEIDLGSITSSSSSSSSSDNSKKKKKRKKKQSSMELQLNKHDAPAKEHKKGKKKKGKDKKLVHIQERTQSEIMLMELEKMHARIANEAMDDDMSMSGGSTLLTEGKKEKKKKKDKKKHSKKEKAAAGDAEQESKQPPKRLTHKQMAEWLKQQELEAKRLAEQERKRLQQEKEEMIEQEMIRRYEQINRKEQLQPGIELADRLQEESDLAELETAEAEEWIRYLRCDGLPKVTDSGEMYTYLYRTNLSRDEVIIEKAATKTNEILGLLSTLERRILNPLMTDTPANVERWKEIRQEFREMQQDRLDVATYRLLRNVFGNLIRRSIPLADYSRIEDNFILCLWVAVALPTPIFNPRRPPKPRAEIDFHEIEMNVVLPLGFKYDFMSVRGMYVKYDHLSDLCESYEEPATPDILKMNLHEATEQEYVARMQLAFEMFERKPKKHRKSDKRSMSIVSDTKSLDEVSLEKKDDSLFVGPVDEEEPELTDEVCLGYDKETPITVDLLDLHIIDPPVDQVTVEQEDQLYAEALNALVQETELPTINLRQYVILGGLYFINLYYQPPQPREMVGNETQLSTLILPKELQEVEFFAQYVPPKIVNDGTKSGPEIQEEELKYQEAEFEKLIHVTIDLPKHVVWIATPKVCQWDKTNQVWTTKDIYGEKYNEEKQFMEFRAGRFGIFGMAVFKYPNLPYQSWDIIPQKNGQVMVRYTTAILSIDFLINEDQICIHKLKNSPNNTVDHIVGIYCKFPVLKQMMLECGIDIFPCHDTFLYVNGTCQKHWPMEKHLYSNIAMLYAVFNFSWSRWNMSAGRRSIVFQMREYFPEKIKQIPYSMVLITPLRATLIDCNEVSSLYNEEPMPDIKFCPDLSTLIRATQPVTVRMKLDAKTSRKMAHTLSTLLIETKIFSFS